MNSIKERSSLNERRSLLKELKIFDFQNTRRIRIGSNNDGGYVLLDYELESIDVIYSYGVGNNSDFEAMFCEKYHAIARLYDHTVDSAPLEKDFFYFKKEGVGGERTQDRNTIENHLIENGDNGKRLLLQMDVDGAEWDTLLQTPNSVLSLFDQVLIEVHGLGTDCSKALNGGEIYLASLNKKIKVLRQINELFNLYHVHVNTEGGFHYIGWYKIPDVLELTYVNKKLEKKAEYSKVIFPTKFDRPNVKGRKDQDLHFWPFYPGMIHHFLYIASHNGWKGWKDILRIPYDRIKMNLRTMRTMIGLRK